jgi:hypothetical protein
VNARAAFVDRSIGEVRGVITLDDLPERLIVRRDDDDESQVAGARSTGRVLAVERALETAFIRMPSGPDAVTPLPPSKSLDKGASVEVEVVSEPRAGKGAVVRVLGASSGPPRVICGPPEVEDMLRHWAPGEVETGEAARAAADEAQETALRVSHPLPGGGEIHIEPTRALTAIDVDLGAGTSSNSPQARRKANLAAIATAARVLRLKALGGPIVFDLAGAGHNGPAIAEAAKAAFGPDNPGVVIGPVSRFGLFELALPRRQTPLSGRLCDADGRVSARTSAMTMLRALEREGRANPGARLTAVCAPDVAAAAACWLAALSERLGARFQVLADAGAARETIEVRAE